MAKFLGSNQTFEFASTSYECIVNGSHSASVSVAVQECSGASGATVNKIVSDAVDHTFSFDLLVEAGATGSTVVNALLPGSTGAFNWYPESDASGNLEYAAATAYIETMDADLPVDGHFTVSIGVVVDGTVTIGTVL